MPTARQAGCYGVLGNQFYVAGGDASGTTLAALGVMESYNPPTIRGRRAFPACPTLRLAAARQLSEAIFTVSVEGNASNPVTNYVQIYQPPLGSPAISTAISASGFGGFSSIAPGTWMEIYGSGLARDTRSWAASDFNGSNAPTTLDGTKVTIAGIPAFIDYISATQVNALVPSNVPTGLQQITVTTTAGPSAAYNVTVNQAEPGFLAPSSFTIGGIPYAVALFTDGTYVLPAGAIAGIASRPAKPGDVITLYGIGFGPVTPSIPAGQLVQQINSLAMPLLMEIGGVSVTPAYDGLAPNYTGLFQFNVTVPNLSPGNAALTFSVGGAAGTQTLYILVGN